MKNYYKQTSDEIEKEVTKINKSDELEKTVEKHLEKMKVKDLIKPIYHKDKGWHSKTRKKITRKGA